jgi:hypothetical protein
LVPYTLPFGELQERSRKPNLIPVLGGHPENGLPNAV